MDQTTERLSSLVSNLRYDDLGPDVVHQVKRTLVDTLGCAIGGYDSQPAQIARRLAKSVTCITPSRVLGTRDDTSPDMAAFANGVMVRYLDYNDSYFSPGGGHPSDMIPAVLALAGPGARDGRTVVTAIVVAYEIFCRLSDLVVVRDLGWDQGVFGVIGAACGAAKVLDLGPEQIGHTISLAAVPNLPLGVTRTSELSMWKGCAGAAAARSGVFAAQLASLGLTGPFEPFDGRRGLWEQLRVEPPSLGRLDGAGSFRILDTIFKSFPCQVHTQVPISLALELRTRVTASEVASVTIHTYGEAYSSPTREPEKWNPTTRETADHSIPFLVARALLDGEVTPDTFTQSRIRDPEVRSLMDKIGVEEESEFTRRYPREYPCRMEVTNVQGRTFVGETSHPKGHAGNPIKDADVEQKFRRLAGPVLTPRQCDRLLELIWSIDELADMNELFDSLVVEGK